MLTCDGLTLIIETDALVAVFQAGRLRELTAKATGRRLLDDPTDGPALQLVYAGGETFGVESGRDGQVSLHRLSDRVAQYRLSGWDGEGVLTISLDPATGDVLLEPAACASRRGCLAVRWPLAGLAPDLELVAPFYQGVKLPPTDPLLRRRWTWPMHWEAGLAIFQGPGGGLWVHCRDDRYRYKALHIAEGGLGFDTEAYGPLDDSRGAGGLVWRLNVHDGDWRVPAGHYRDWLWQAYGLAAQAAARRPWQDEIRFALSWFGGDPEILRAVAERLDPTTVLVHYSNWRTDGYDENYPTYTPSDHARAVIAEARELGFHILPHANSVDMDPSHEVYQLVRDFEYRDLLNDRRHGWAWDQGVLPVPSSNEALVRNRARKVMIKVHPGLSLWRAELARRLGDVVDDLTLDSIFIDVTLCSGNLRNCLVENTTSSEGMNRLIREIAALRGGLAVGGEGLNEITCQGLSFAQAHLFASHQRNCEGLDRLQVAPLGDFLFGRLCRTFGYSGLTGADEAEELRLELHHRLGAIPTIVARSAEAIRNPNAAVRRQFERAAG